MGLRISQMIRALVAQDSDVLAGVQNDANKKFPLSLLYQYVRGKLGPDLDGKQVKITASGILMGDGQGGVSAATAGTDYQAPLTIDATPTASSTNPVQSGGVYTDVRTRVPNYGKGKNLLRNWYFVGGGTGRGVFPVNQRGIVTLTISNATRYFVDGWRANGTFTLSLSTNGLTIAATGQVYFQQFLSDILPWGKSITASMLTTDGITTFSGNLPASKPAASTVILSATDSKGRFALINDASNLLNLQIRTDSTTRTVVAVKLELGTEQTVAHQENGTWVLNEIPDYEYELYRCITSTADSSDTYANKSLATEQQLAYVETGATASRNYSAGQYICWNGLLYTADINIVSGATLSASGGSKNLTETTIGNSLYTSIGYASSSTSITSVTGTIVRVGVNYIFNLQIVVGTAIARFIPLVEFSAPASVSTTVTNPAVWIVNHQAAGTQYAAFVSYANSKHVISSSTQLPVGTYSVYAVVTMM